MGCTASKMEHAVTDDVNGRADIEEARAENQSLKDENQALKDENQALKAGTPDGSDKCGTSRCIKALVDKVQELKIEVQSLKAGSTPDGSDKLGTSRDVKALEDEVQSLKAGSTPDGSDKLGTSRYIKALVDKVQELKDEVQSLKAGSTPDDSDKLGTSRYIKALEDEVQSLKAEKPDGSDKLGTSRDVKVDAQPATKWGVPGWVRSISAPEAVAKALKAPAGADPFNYVCSLSLADLTEKLEAEKLSGLVAPLWSAIEKLRGQAAATGAALNAKFAAEGDAFKGEMGFGGAEQFYGGLEALIGPPLMVEGSLLKAMEEEHCNKKDANLPFATSNGIEGATPRQEWGFVVAPLFEDGCYPERGGDFRTVHPEWCRKAEPLAVYEAKMADEMNPRLVKAGQAPLTKEELVAARMYTGPMYEKYNGVLRFFSARGADGAVLLEYASVDEVPFLQKKCGWLHLGEWAESPAGKGEPAAVRWTWNNQYTTTIHAINSIIVKLSPLTKITPLYRGWTGATLPEGFFTPDALGFRGGVEYGFSSTTTDRAQAVHHVEGKSSTMLELGMSMIDRGADFSWLSQYPHERETQLPPLMGLQVRSTRVEGSILVVDCNFSINMATPTLEQVVGKRLKLLTDMGASVRQQVRSALVERGRDAVVAEKDAGSADRRITEYLEANPAEWYIEDTNFSAAQSHIESVKREALREERLVDEHLRGLFAEVLNEAGAGAAGKPFELISGEATNAAKGLYHFMCVKDPFSEADTSRLEAEIRGFVDRTKEHAVLVTLLANATAEQRSAIAVARGPLTVGSRSLSAEEVANEEVSYLRRVAWRPVDGDKVLTPLEIAQRVEEDLLGNLEYILRAEAGSSSTIFPNSEHPRDCGPSGRLDERTTDDGIGMVLDDFVAHQNAVDAELTRSQVAALRLYTTSAFKYLNSPLRHQSDYYQVHKPHPLPLTAAYINEGIKKLRSAYAVQHKETATSETVLWRGMRNVSMRGAFMSGRQGGTELAFGSVTKDLKVSLRYATEGGASANNLVFKFAVDNFLQYGAELKWASAFPAEEEVLYPPLTYLQPTGREETIEVGEHTFHVVEVRPNIP